MKITTALLLVVVVIGMSGCRETAAPFETIDELSVLQRADLHGQLGHLIQIQSKPKGGGQGVGATTVYAKVFDKDISDAPYYLQWRHVLADRPDELSNAAYLDTIVALIEQAEAITLVDELPQGVPFFEEVVLGKPNTTADRVTHCLRVTTPDGVFYVGVHIMFTNEVKTWLMTKLSQPLRILLLEEQEEPPTLLLSLLPEVVRTTLVKDNDGTSTVSLQQDTVTLVPPPEGKDTLTLAAYSKEVLEPPPPTAGPPAIIALSAVSDNEDSAQATAGDTVTLTFTTNKPIVLQRSRVSFVPANGSHGRVISAVADSTNRYTADLRITDGMAAGMLQVRVTLVDDDGNTSGAVVRDTAVTIYQAITLPTEEPDLPETQPPLEPVVHPDQEFWEISKTKASFHLQSLSEVLASGLEGYSEEQIIAHYKELLLSVDILAPGLDFILYDLWGICLQERPEKAAEAVREGGIIIHPLAKNGLVFDWMHLAYAYPDTSKEERLLLFRRLVRFWGVDPLVREIGERSVNGLPIGTEILPGDYLYIQPPTNPFLTVTERQVRRELRQISQEIDNLLVDHPGFPIIKLYNTALLTDYGIPPEFVFINLWNIYQEEQPAQAATIAVDDIPLHPITNNGLLFAWVVLQYDNPEKSKDERLVLFRQLARQGKVQPILAE